MATEKHSLRTKIRQWYRGKFIPENNLNSDVIIVVDGFHKRHWTAHFARTLVTFWLKHWQWIIGTAIAITGLFTVLIIE